MTIEITIDGKTMTMEEARKLYLELNKIFSRKVVPYYPIRPDKWVDERPWWERPTITWTDNTRIL